MISKDTLQFLTKLKTHNNREWFNDNKAVYEKTYAEFKQVAEKIILSLSKFDKGIATLEVKDCIFRIYRDVRFSKDKSPYKNHFGAHFVPGGKKALHALAGYYLHIEPNNSFLAGGAYMPPPDWLNLIRKEIHYNAKQLKRILNNKDFKNYFGEMGGGKLNRPPRGYEANHPNLELLKHKSFLASHTLTNRQITSPNFITHTTKVFNALYPFNKFFNQAWD